MNTRKRNHQRKSINRKKNIRKSSSRKILRNRTLRNRTLRNRTLRNRTRKMYKKSLRGGTNAQGPVEQEPVNQSRNKAKEFYHQRIKADFRELSEPELQAMIELDQNYLQAYGDFYGKNINLDDYQTNKEKYEAIRNRLQNFIRKKKQKKAQGCYSNAGYPVCNTAITQEECNGKKDNVGHNCIWMGEGEFNSVEYNRRALLLGFMEKGMDSILRDSYDLSEVGPKTRLVHGLTPVITAPIPLGTAAALPIAKFISYTAKAIKHRGNSTANQPLLSC